MQKRHSSFFWGKFLFYIIIINFLILNFTAKEALSDEQNPNSINLQSTTVIIETSNPVVYKAHFFNEPPHLVINFDPQTISAEFKREISVNRGMVKKIYCRYYQPQNSAERWLKSLTFVLIAKTGYKITGSDGKIFISIQNTPEQSINSTWTDELVIRERTPRGWGSVARREALRAALMSVRIKRQSAAAAKNLTPVEMIATGTKALLTGQPVSQTAQPQEEKIVSVGEALGVKTKLPTTLAGFAAVSLVFLSLMWGILVVDKIKNQNKIAPKAKPENAAPKNEKKIIEEFFLREDELQKWPKYYQLEPKTTTAGQPAQQTAVLVEDIAERRKFPRADVSNARGILNRALVGSKTQPFKNIKVNNISKGGLCFSVKSKETKFRSPTILKLYFANSTKPVDLWVKVVWEKDLSQSDGKDVGAKFTKVPKESWDKIMESFGHRLGLNGASG